MREIIRRRAATQISNADAAARRIEALIDGLWLSILLYPSDRLGGLTRVTMCSTVLAVLFPKHFSPYRRKWFLTSLDDTARVGRKE